MFLLIEDEIELSNSKISYLHRESYASLSHTLLIPACRKGNFGSSVVSKFQVILFF